jgi:hypothetical protein
MEQLRITGGARIGSANATLPFAVLTVTKDKLNLNASIIGNCTFTADDIISIEPYSGIIGHGIKIFHKVENYKENIVFWSFKKSNEIISLIEQTGFLNNNQTQLNQAIKNEVVERQKQGMFPIRIPIAIVIMVIWCALFLIDIAVLVYNLHNGKIEEIPLKMGSMMAFGFLIILSVLTFISKRFRKLILKDGRGIEDISRFLYFLILFCCLMLLTNIIFF